MIRLLIGGLLVVAICAYMGISDIVEAHRSGASPRNGIETLCVALIFALLVFFAGRRELRNLFTSRRD